MSKMEMETANGKTQKSLTPDEIIFLDLIRKVRQKYGVGVILAVETIIEAMIKNSSQNEK